MNIPSFACTLLALATLSTVVACKEKIENEPNKVENIYDLERSNPTGTGTDPGGAAKEPTAPLQGNSPGL